MNIAALLRDVAANAGDQPRSSIAQGKSPSPSSIGCRRVWRRSSLPSASAQAIARLCCIRFRSACTILIALFRLGATALLLDPSAGRAYLDSMLSPGGTARVHRRAACASAAAGPRGIRRIPIAIAVGGRVPLATTVDRADRDRPDRLLIAPCDDDASALLTFTSGSTGEPKAAMRTHGFLLAQQRVLAQTLGLRAGAVDLTTLPVFVLANLAAGVTSVLPDADLRRPGAIDPAPVLAQMARHRPASLVASPALLDRLIRRDCDCDCDCDCDSDHECAATVIRSDELGVSASASASAGAGVHARLAAR